jgi:hypothetical protein
MLNENHFLKILHIIFICMLFMGVSCPRKHESVRWTIRAENQKSNILLLGPKLSQDQIQQALEEWFTSKGQDPTAHSYGSSINDWAPSTFYIETPQDLDLAFNSTVEEKLDRKCFSYLQDTKVLEVIPDRTNNQFCMQKINSRDFYMLTFLEPQESAKTAELAFSDLRSYLITVFGHEKVQFGKFSRVVRTKFRN